MSAWFIHRPIATLLLTLALLLLGISAWRLIAVAPLPQVDFPVISVQASLPGASPEVMASSVAAPLERTLASIAGVNEITSTSLQGSCTINIQFDLSLPIDSAAREVQAAILAARSLLPTSMIDPPSYKKVNPADSPIMVMALTSDLLDRAQLYDVASTLLAQKIAQSPGIGRLVIGGGALPATRIQVDGQQLSHLSLSLNDIVTLLRDQHTHLPLGQLATFDLQWQLDSNQQLMTHEDLGQVVIKQTGNGQLQLQHIAQIKSGQQDAYTYGASNGRPAVLLILYRQPGANIIDTVDHIRAQLPHFQQLLPKDVSLDIVMDRTPTIRSALADIELTLVLSVALVVLVVLLFFKRWQIALIPALSIPLALLTTVAIIYQLGFTLNHISLMALIIAAGFVVDDSIVVLENILRHHQHGLAPQSAALTGARQMTFTIIAMSLSLIAVFIPIILMDGIMGRLFQEFALTLSIAILISLLIALTITPSLTNQLLQHYPLAPTHRSTTKLLGLRWYRHGLAWSLRHPKTLIVLLFAVIGLNIHWYISIDKGFFPQQDTGRMLGRISADQSISFASMQEKLNRYLQLVQQDPDVDTVTAYMGFGASNTAIMFITLKAKPARKASVQDIIQRLRPKMNSQAGASLFLIPIQDIRAGTQSSSASYQLSVMAESYKDLRQAEEQIISALTPLSELQDVTSEQQDKGRQTYIHVYRDRLEPFGLTMRDVDQALGQAYGQQPFATQYQSLNQYRIILETLPSQRQFEQQLSHIYLINHHQQAVPLTAIADIEHKPAPLTISHQSGMPAATISFNLSPGIKLNTAMTAIDQAIAQINLPEGSHYQYVGNAKAFSQQNSKQPLLILAAIISLYLILGILYENLRQPITILSTLPSAGIGALLALQLADMQLDIMGLIGIFLLIGLVKKNAILMIDFALEHQRYHRRTPAQAIYLAAQQRLRPIMMTTLAALFGAIPLAIGFGDGAELRQPLGVTIIGGLIISQLLTLYTVPVIYLSLAEKAKRNTQPSFIARFWMKLKGQP